MRSSLRNFYFGLLALCGFTASAQNLVTVIGSVSPCNAIPYPVRIFSDPGTLPLIDTTIYTTATNCSYSFSFNPITTSGGIVAMTSCDGGITWGTADSASYSAPVDTLIMLLNCGGGPANCQAAFTFQQAMGGGALIPWQMTTTNQSTGPAPILYNWWLPDGSASTAAQPNFTFTQAGVYGICLTISTANCSSVVCDTVVVDSAGYISAQPVWYDCLGTLWGPNTPGTPCDDNNPMTNNDTWSANCVCGGNGGAFDCLGIPGGSNMPGTACTDTTFLGIFTGTWSANCVCQPDSSNTTDCLGIVNGPNLPGTACAEPSGATGTWDANCTCIPDSSTTACNANFWVIQAYDSTSTGVEPIPNEVWVWNLSTYLGNGPYQFLWSFGDGTSSTEAYPTHVYANGGPFTLCLTMSNANCTSTYCDTLSVDANGILNQLVIGGDHGTVGQSSGSGSRSEGFTLNVIQQIPTSISETPAFADLKAWPNPVLNELNLTFNTSENGTVPVTVIDPSGRTVINGTQRLSAGSNTLRIPTSNLEPGLYMVRIGNDAHSISQRFMKVR